MKRGEFHWNNLFSLLVGVVAVIIVVVFLYRGANEAEGGTIKTVTEESKSGVEKFKNFFGLFTPKEEEDLEFIRSDPGGYLNSLISRGNDLMGESKYDLAQKEFEHYLDICGGVEEGVLKPGLSLSDYNTKYRSGKTKLKEEEYNGLREKCDEKTRRDVYGYLMKAKEEREKHAEVALEGEWRRLIEAGDKAMDEKRYGDAQKFYQEAQEKKAPSIDIDSRLLAVGQKIDKDNFELELRRYHILWPECENLARTKFSIFDGVKCEIVEFKRTGQYDQLLIKYKQILNLLQDEEDKAEYYLGAAESLQKLGRENEALNLYEDVLVLGLDVGGVAAAKLKEVYTRDPGYSRRIKFSKMIFEYEFVGRFDSTKLLGDDYKWTYTGDVELYPGEIRYLLEIKTDDTKSPVANGITGSDSGGYIKENPEEWNNLDYLELEEGFQLNYRIRDFAGNVICGAPDGDYILSVHGGFSSEEDAKLRYRKDDLCGSLDSFPANIVFYKIHAEAVQGEGDPTSTEVVFSLAVTRGLYKPDSMAIVNAMVQTQ
ncbi:MAG: hypothetical protein ABIB47_05865 [Candidatus Woesearchaeota archaeon]